MKTTNDQINANILERGFITEQEIKLLKNRSNEAKKDLFNYDLISELNDGFGVPVSEEQGEKGLLWLKKYARSRRSKFGYYENDIINKATAKDFTFWGFRNISNYKDYPNFQPIYKIGGLSYYVLSGEPIF